MPALICDSLAASASALSCVSVHYSLIILELGMQCSALRSCNLNDWLLVSPRGHRPRLQQLIVDGFVFCLSMLSLLRVK